MDRCKISATTSVMDVVGAQISRFREKEDSVILTELSTGKIICEWLNFQQLDFHARSKVLEIIAKACAFRVERGMHHEFIQQLVSLKAPLITFLSVFLSTIQGQQIACEDVSLLQLVFDVVHSMFECLPVSSMDFIDTILPQLLLILKKKSGEMAGELTNNVTGLLEQKKNIFPQTVSSLGEDRKEEELPPPLCDFRDVALLPDKEEIESKVRPYLRANVVKGPYDNVDHYLDVQFRLMREDVFRYLRECIAEYKRKEWSRDSSALLENGHVYFDAKISSKKYSNGIFSIADVYIGKVVNWETTKRLISNSLLCMSSDGFQTFIFAYVRSRSQSRTNALSCSLQFSAANQNDAESIEIGKVYDIIETTSFYESYRYVLERLQLFDGESFPLSSSILFLKDCDRQPEYWRKLAFLSTVQSENDAYERMLRHGYEHFDEHQKQAFRMALSNCVSMIQGPPGTGKTYLGLQIVQWLVHNASNHMGTPILVICYTNHALDQFLEGVLTFTNKVVRIGGQSKNICLEPYHINKIVNVLLKRTTEEESYDENELQSLEIGLKILGGSWGLERVGRYTFNVRHTEKRLAVLEQFICELDDNPLYDETVMIQLLPQHLKQEILGYWNSYTGTALSAKFLIRALENWLCISTSFLYVYEDLPDFLFVFIKEFIGHIKDNGYLDMRRDSEKHSGNQNLEPQNRFVKGLWKMFLSTNLSSTGVLKSVPTDIDHRVRYFLKEHALDKKIVFKFLEKAASKCLEKNNDGSEFETREIWSNSLLSRWAIFFEWKSKAKSRCSEQLRREKSTYLNCLKEREEVRFRNSIAVAKKADILGLTTTGAAKHSKMLQQIGPRVVVAEEAAEVLEAHITTALTTCTKHLILIGDHKQLRPIPSVYELEKKFNLGISMFERLLTNGAPSRCLQTQHRMRPCIAELLVPEIYDNLENHPSVLEYEDIKGMASNMYFVKHDIYEDGSVDLRSHRNKHEAHFLVGLCRYLLLQGHDGSSITVLTTYAGQLQFLNEIMNRKLLKDVRVTTVDNFQGEENDIILLSFVRSNRKNSLGFLEISNRICVALSRARKGLYCIGNFDSFAEKCDTWRKIIAKLVEMQLISSNLPLKCQNHPEKITLVSRASDFDKVIHGGCTEKCTYRLACGHVCPLRCHIATKRHDDMVCSKKCRNRCQKENQEVTVVLKGISKVFSKMESPQNFDQGAGDNCGNDRERGLPGNLKIASDQYITGTFPSRPKDPEHSFDVNGVGTEDEINNCVSSSVTLYDRGFCFQERPCFAPGARNNYCADDVSDTDSICVVKCEEFLREVLHESPRCDHPNSSIGTTTDFLNMGEVVLPQLGSLGQVTNSSTALHVYDSQENKADTCFTEGWNEVAANRHFKVTGQKCENCCFSKKEVETSAHVTVIRNLSEMYSCSGLCKSGSGDPSGHKEVSEPTTLLAQTSSDHKVSCDLKVTNRPAFIVNADSKMKSNKASFIALEDTSSLSVIKEGGGRSSELGMIAEKCSCDHFYRNSNHTDEKSEDSFSNGLTEFEHVDCENESSLPRGSDLSTRLSESVLDSQIGDCCINLKHDKPQQHGREMFREVPERGADSFDCEKSDHKNIQHGAVISKKLHCQHETSILCSEYNLKQDCKAEVEVQLPCLHSLSIRCSDCIWKKEMKCTYEESLLMPCGKLIHYICSEGPNHGDCTEVVLKCGHKVPCYVNVDEYKCDVPIKCVLPCSHQINVPCTIHYYSKILASMRYFSESAITENQNVLLQKLCGEKCDFLMECGHRCLGKCGICTSHGRHIDCRERVKRDLPCGHQLECECHIKKPSCTLRCETILTCGHRCPGECDQCFEFQIHAVCSEIVNRNLPCGHRVELSCGLPLPVCERRCLFGCQHSRCINSCMYPCAKCSKPCEWKCEHFSCTLRCGELCNRPACNVRCPSFLTCGHQCAGYCGEPCPNLCLTCDKVSAVEAQGNSNWYVLLEDCQHSLLNEDLNSYFEQKPHNSCPLCPQCGAVITRNRRYGNCLKSWLVSDLHNYQLGNGNEPLRRHNPSLANSIFDICISKMIQKKINFALIPEPMKTKMCHNISVLRHILHRNHLLNFCGMLDVFKSLEQWLFEHLYVCSEQQVEESCRTVRRLCALFFLKSSSADEPRKENSDNGFSEIFALLETKPFGEKEEERFMEALRQNALKIQSGHTSLLMNFIQYLNVIQESSRYQTIDFSNYFRMELLLD